MLRRSKIKITPKIPQAKSNLDRGNESLPSTGSSSTNAGSTGKINAPVKVNPLNSNNITSPSSPTSTNVSTDSTSPPVTTTSVTTILPLSSSSSQLSPSIVTTSTTTTTTTTSTSTLTTSSSTGSHSVTLPSTLSVADSLPITTTTSTTTTNTNTTTTNSTSTPIGSSSPKTNPGGNNNIPLDSVDRTESSSLAIPSLSVTQSVSPNSINKPPSSSPSTLISKDILSSSSSTLSTSITPTTLTLPTTQSSDSGGKHSGEGIGVGVGGGIGIGIGIGGGCVGSESDPKSVSIRDSNCINIVDQVDVNPANSSNSNNIEKSNTNSISTSGSVNVTTGSVTSNGDTSINPVNGENEPKRPRKRIKLTPEDLLDPKSITLYNVIHASISRTKKKPKEKKLDESIDENLETNSQSGRKDASNPSESSRIDNEDTMDSIMTTASSASTIITGEHEVAEEETRENDTIGPRVKVGPDGQLIIDEESLVIKKPKPVETTTIEEVVTGKTTYASFRKRPPSARWSKSETIEFYTALHLIGPDFSLMSNLFFDGKRTRTDLKNKFRRENKLNKHVIEKALYDGDIAYCLAHESIESTRS